MRDVARESSRKIGLECPPISAEIAAERVANFQTCKIFNLKGWGVFVTPHFCMHVVTELISPLSIKSEHALVEP